MVTEQTLRAWEQMHPMPVSALPAAAWGGAHIRVLRGDLSDPRLSGNKWWKLKYNLLEASRLGHDTLLTFGGAHSNHLYATAAAGQYFGFRTIGLVRGELLSNPTLDYCQAAGMQLVPVTRSLYREKHSMEFLAECQRRYGRFYMLPEGGTNELALRGCREVAAQWDEVDVVICPCGTGGTLAGWTLGLRAHQQAIGVAVLKGGFLGSEVKKWLEGHQPQASWEVWDDWHHGGYARLSPALSDFMQTFERQYAIPLEPVYSGKMFFALYHQSRTGRWAGKRILAVHTGGLRNEKKLSDDNSFE